MRTREECEKFYLDAIAELGEHPEIALAKLCGTLDHAAECARAELRAANQRLIEIEAALDVVAEALCNGPDRLLDAARAIES
jgi:hypothetical protein